jgi:glycine C-acetyltransferase
VYGAFKEQLTTTLESIRAAGLYKNERELTSAQSAHISTTKMTAINFCANNYLGLADNPDVVAAAGAALQEWGFGMASVRFICGTQTLHTQLEARIADFVGTEAAILYSSCFDANGGIFEALFGEEDVIISDELNHASLIDGIRLCKAKRYRYKNADMDDLELQLKDTASARRRVIVTDGVFSMDGSFAPLDRICDLADAHDALVMVDDSHASGFVGPSGRGSAQHHGVQDQIDIFTSTLGKALGGASGGYTTGRKEIIELLRQRSRPYLFSNSVSPAIVAASLKVLELLQESGELRERLMENTKFFREQMTELGFSILPGEHPIVPIMIGDAARATQMADALLEKGIYVIGFSYPVVPQGKARIRVQISAAHTRADLEFAVQSFKEVRDAME